MSATKKTEEKALKPIDEVRRNLTLMESQFKMALPSHISPEKFQRVVMTAVGNDPKLLAADKQSFYSASMKCAQAGLLPDGKEAALVAFGDKVQFMPMIGGLLKLARNSGDLASITAQVVFQNDTFRYWVDSKGEHIQHEPNFFSDRGRAIGVYALATLKDGSLYLEVMTEKQVLDVRESSKSKNGPAWSGSFAHEMWRKSVLKRLSKRLPLSTDLDHALNADNDDYDFSEPTEEEARSAREAVSKMNDQKPPKEKKSRLKEAMSQESGNQMAEAAAIDIEATEIVDSPVAEQVHIPADGLPI